MTPGIFLHVSVLVQKGKTSYAQKIREKSQLKTSACMQLSFNVDSVYKKQVAKSLKFHVLGRPTN